MAFHVFICVACPGTIEQNNFGIRASRIYCAFSGFDKDAIQIDLIGSATSLKVVKVQCMYIQKSAQPVDGPKLPGPSVGYQPSIVQMFQTCNDPPFVLTLRCSNIVSCIAFMGSPSVGK